MTSHFRQAAAERLGQDPFYSILVWFGTARAGHCVCVSAGVGQCAVGVPGHGPREDRTATGTVTDATAAGTAGSASNTVACNIAEWRLNCSRLGWEWRRANAREMRSARMRCKSRKIQDDIPCMRRFILYRG